MKVNLRERAEQLKKDVPVLGYLDDVILLPLLITLTIRLIPADKLEECRLRAEGMWSNEKRKVVLRDTDCGNMVANCSLPC